LEIKHQQDQQLEANWMEAFVDHYAQYLREPSDTLAYRPNAAFPPIQIMRHTEVVAGCEVFSSLGLIFYPNAGGVAEVICPVDDGADIVPQILADRLFHVLTRPDPLPIQRGTAVNGIQDLNSSFVEKFNKTAIYFTDPYGLPEDFAFVPSGDNEGRMYLAIFLTDKEYNFLLERGCDALEDQFEAKAVDPYDLKRRSCV
jgi:hypothetical protein